MLPRHRAILLAVVAILSLGGATACSSGSTADTSVTATGPIQRVDVDGFQQAIDDGATVVDVRTPAEYASGHIAGAVNIDVESPTFADQIAGLNPGASYAVYCRSGNRSGTATTAMVDGGFTDVLDLDGGIIAWQSAGQPVE